MEIADLLETMRREAREDHQTLVEKVDNGFALAAAHLGQHEKEDLKALAETNARLQPLESLNSNMKWFLATLIAAIIMVGAGGVWDYVANHMHPEVTHGAR